MIKKNKYGTPIFKEPKYDCEFCYDNNSIKKYELRPFPICTNPKLNYDTKKLGSIIISCPDDCPFFNSMQENKIDLDRAEELISENSIEGWLMLEENFIYGFVAELSEQSLEYFRQLLKYFGYRMTHDDKIPKENFLFTNTFPDQAG